MQISLNTSTPIDSSTTTHHCALPRLSLGVLGIGSASITYNVIDFATLVFHCVGSAIIKQGDCAAHTAKTKRDDFQINLKSSLSFLDSTSNTLFVIALALLVIPAGWSVSAPDAHRGHFFRLTLHSLMRFSTLKFQGSNMQDIEVIFTMPPKNNSSLRTRTAR